MSIYWNLFLLTTQTLISRILFPGKSNFVSASVRANQILCLKRSLLVISHANQVLDCSISNASNVPSTTTAIDQEEERSQPFVPMEVAGGL
jgi:hypothetical protein